MKCPDPNSAIRNFLLLVALSVLPVTSAFGQAATATLSGTALDQAGAVIPNANVSAVNTATSARRQATTNEQGYFTFPLLPPATYRIRVERDGFAPVEVPDVVLNVGDNKALQIQLKAGDVNAQVTIDSDAETVRTDGSVGTVVNRQFVANMPLNGRSLQALIQLVPGVVLANNKGTSTSGAQFSVNGQRVTSNYFTVDGVSANTGINATTGSNPDASGSGQVAGTTALGGTNSLVSLDALQEFRIETSTFAPEFGRTTGGQISLVTRGGTNQFHGSASEYFRNEALDANDWFANANRLPKPKERQNLFGGVLGGPLYLPRFGEGGPSLFSGKNRLFFFASYEGLRLQQPRAQVKNVPSVAFRSQVPATMKPFLNAFPLPNGPDFGDGAAQFAASYSDPASFNIFSLRFDGQVTKRLSSFFRLSRAPSEAKTRTSALSTVQGIIARNDSYTGGVTWVAGPHFTADVRVNWTRNSAPQVAYLDTFGGAVIPNVSDIFAPGRNPSQSFLNFANSVGNFAHSYSFLWGAGNADVVRQLNVVGAIGWSVGAHQLKFGVDYLRLLPLIGGSGVYLESNQFFSTQSVINQIYDFHSIRDGDPIPRRAIIQSQSIYAQDSWRASRGLTLTYGLRFERVPPPGEGTGRLPRTVLGIDAAVPVNLRLAPLGTPIFQGRFGAFAPRFGAAFRFSDRPRWEASIRGGVGIFYDLGLGSIAAAYSNGFPYVANRQDFGVSFLDPAVRTPPILGISPPGTIGPLFEPNLKLPYTAQWNAAWEQGIGAGETVTVAYVGAAGRRLLARQQLNQPVAEWPNTNTQMNVLRNSSRSRYDALQIQYRRRLSRGLQALSSYTLGSSRDDLSDDLGSGIGFQPGVADQGSQEWGPSDFDARHLLSTAVTYDFPKISGPPVLRALAGGWSADLLGRYQSAFPVTPQANGINVNNNGISFSRRPDVVPGQPFYIDDPAAPGGRRFNKAAFVNPAPGVLYGNFPRNGLRAFPASQVDLALRRGFRLSEAIKLEFRGELFNVFNHPNFGPVNRSITSSQFGQPSSMLNGSLGGLNLLYQMGGPRSGQLAIKLIW
ncbi:MAG TPA: carboxypeptidase regulatory-like domain-containing protein [Pyrinomonadaceae bacterium]|jgi:hypothetical protein